MGLGKSTQRLWFMTNSASRTSGVSTVIRGLGFG